MINSYNIEKETSNYINLDLSKNIGLFSSKTAGKKTLLRYLIEKEILKNSEELIVIITDNQNLSENIEYFSSFNNRSEDILFFGKEVNNDKNIFYNLFNDIIYPEETFGVINDLFDILKNKILIINDENKEIATLFLNYLQDSYLKESEHLHIGSKIFIENYELVKETDYLKESKKFKSNIISIFNSYDEVETIENIEVKFLFKPKEYLELQYISKEFYLSITEIKELNPGAFYFKDENGIRYLYSLEIMSEYQIDYNIAELKSESFLNDYIFFNDEDLNNLYRDFVKNSKNNELNKYCFYAFKTIQYFYENKEEVLISEKDKLLNRFEGLILKANKKENLLRYAVFYFYYKFGENQRIKKSTFVENYFKSDLSKNVSVDFFNKITLKEENKEKESFLKILKESDLKIIKENEAQIITIEEELKTEHKYSRENFKRLLYLKDETIEKNKKEELELLSKKLEYKLSNNILSFYKDSEIIKIIYLDKLTDIDFKINNTRLGNDILQLSFKIMNKEDYVINIINQDIIKDLLESNSCK